MPHFPDVYFHRIQWDTLDSLTQFSSPADVGFFKNQNCYICTKAFQLK